MKTNRLIYSLLALAGSVVFTAPAFAETKEAEPESGLARKEYPLSRYAHLDKKSPFEFDPPPVKPTEGPDVFEGVSLAGYCGSGKSLTVYIFEGVKEKKRVTVYGDASPFKKRDTSGFRILALNAGKTLKKTTVTLERGGVQKEIKFDDETLVAKGTGGAGKNIQMVPGPNGTMVPRTLVPRPSNAPGGQNQQAYQAPAPFIMGQGGGGQPQQGNQPGVNQNGIQLQQGQQQAALNMSNQQLLNHLTGPNGQPQQQTPNVVIPQVTNTPAAEQPRVSIPPQRRRVVLPTQQ